MIKMIPRYMVLLTVALMSACGGGSSDSGNDTNDTTYSISGQIAAPSSALVDSDVNDPLQTYTDNSSFTDAQSIPTPATLGGYINMPGEGASGRSVFVGDRDDYFVATLTAGQSVTLYMANDTSEHDIDLYLYDSNRNLVDASLENAESEQLTIATNGTYYLRVTAASDVSTTATAYVMTVGQSDTVASASMRLSSDFVTGQAIVKAQPAINLAIAFATPYRAAGNYSILAGDSSRETLVNLNEVMKYNHAYAALASAKPHADIHEKMETLQAIKRLRRDPQVRYAGPNYIYQSHKTPNDPRYNLQWHYSLIDLPAAWDSTTGSSETSVIVAVIDTGVLLNHPDLKAKLVSGYDFISNKDNAADGNGVDSNPDDPGDLALGNTSSFHGTHVAGTIAATSNNSVGVSGVSWDAKIMPLRALGIQGGTEYDIDQAVRYAAGLSNDSKNLPAQSADIINLSLGGPGFSQSSQDLFEEVHDKGVIIIAAAGNESTSTPSYPAAYAGVTSVSAVDLQKSLASYSNKGSTIDIAAPGGEISEDVNGDGYPDGVLSTVGDDSGSSIKFVYGFYQGTSMAAPHVAGVAALMKAVYSDLDATQFDTLLKNGDLTEDIGAAGRDNNFGYGLIDAQLAVSAAIDAAGGDAPTPTATLTTTPSALNFGLSTTQLNLTLKSGGNTSLTVSNISADQTWVSITEQLVNNNGIGRYHVTVDRTGLSAGSHSAIITITSTAGTTTVPVILEVNAAGRSGDAGYHYVLLVDSDTLETLDQVEAEAIDGIYTYEFSGVPSGKYKVVAGTDLDNDALICVQGEACGAYPTMVSPTEIDLTANVDDLDFDTGFTVQFEDVSMSSTEVKTLQNKKQGFRKREAD